MENEGQFLFTVESIVMAQFLRGTLTYIVKVSVNFLFCYPVQLMIGLFAFCIPSRQRDVESLPDIFTYSESI